MPRYEAKLGSTASHPVLDGMRERSVRCLPWLSANHGSRCQSSKTHCKAAYVINRQKTQHICKRATWRIHIDTGADNKACSNAAKLVYVEYVRHY